MGGRGSFSGFVDTVQNAERATIADSKISNYLLDPTKKHYAEFVAVGYSQADPERLKRDLLNGLKSNKAKTFGPNASGARTFEVDVELGVTHKKKFRTIWQIDSDATAPRLITAHRIGGNRK